MISPPTLKLAPLYIRDFNGTYIQSEEGAIADLTMLGWPFTELSKRFDLKIDSSDPDLVITMCARNEVRPAIKLLQKEACPVVLQEHSEPKALPAGIYDYAVSCMPHLVTKGRNYWLPIISIRVLYPIDRLCRGDLGAYEQLRTREKSRFCNFVYSHRVETREQFCRALMQYKAVDCPGGSLNNIPRIPYGENSSGVSNKIDFCSDYRFTIVFENSQVPGYVSEKILDAFLAGSIPIYWGAEEVVNMFNPKCFINCRDFANFQQVIDHIAKVEADPSLFNGYFAEHFIHDESILHSVTAESFTSFIGEIVKNTPKKRRVMNSWKFRPSLHKLFARILHGSNSGWVAKSDNTPS